MSPSDIVVIAEHRQGKLAEITYELVACGRKLASQLSGTLTCLLLTNASESFRGCDLNVHKLEIIEETNLGEFNPEAYHKVLAPMLREMTPRLVILGNTGSSMDLASSLSLACDATLIGNCTEISANGSGLTATSQLYGGKVTATSQFTSEMGIALLMPGNYPQEEGQAAPAEVNIRTSPVSLGVLKTTFKRFIEPEVTDVDITKVPVLIAAGRGVDGEDNLEDIEELAKALGGATCASRPVVDQGWMDRSRQVGRSGMIVKPRFYLALGLSGAPEHVEGMKDSELIIAINTDETAPIFDIAHYGSSEDLFDVVEPLIEKIRELRGQ